MARMKFSAVLCLALILCSCEPQGNGIPVKHEKIIRNLPTQDREYLLKPLEASMDDIRSIIENDQSLFESDYDVDTNGIKGNVRFKLSGRDTTMLHAVISRSNRTEIHHRFWDDKGDLFLAETEVIWLNSEGMETDKRTYKLYFEEEKELISSYGKVSFNGKPYQSSWVSIQPTKEEVGFVLSQDWR